jgi:hypothetical protein
VTTGSGKRIRITSVGLRPCPEDQSFRTNEAIQRYTPRAEWTASRAREKPLRRPSTAERHRNPSHRGDIASFGLFVVKEHVGRSDESQDALAEKSNKNSEGCFRFRQRISITNNGSVIAGASQRHRNCKNFCIQTGTTTCARRSSKSITSERAPSFLVVPDPASPYADTNSTKRVQI